MISARTAWIDDNLGRGTDGSNPLPSAGGSVLAGDQSVAPDRPVPLPGSPRDRKFKTDAEYGRSWVGVRMFSGQIWSRLIPGCDKNRFGAATKALTVIGLFAE